MCVRVVERKGAGVFTNRTATNKLSRIHCVQNLSRIEAWKRPERGITVKPCAFQNVHEPEFKLNSDCAQRCECNSANIDRILDFKTSNFTGFATAQHI